MILTYQYRIKDSGSVSNRLARMARAVNFVWNFCNETSVKAVRDRSEWLSEYDFHPLTKGAAKDLGLHSQTLQSISAEYVTRRKQFKKLQQEFPSLSSRRLPETSGKT